MNKDLCRRYKVWFAIAAKAYDTYKTIASIQDRTENNRTAQSRIEQNSTEQNSTE